MPLGASAHVVLVCRYVCSDRLVRPSCQVIRLFVSRVVDLPCLVTHSPPPPPACCLRSGLAAHLRRRLWLAGGDLGPPALEVIGATGRVDRSLLGTLAPARDISACGMPQRAYCNSCAPFHRAVVILRVRFWSRASFTRGLLADPCFAKRSSAH